MDMPGTMLLLVGGATEVAEEKAKARERARAREEKVVAVEEEEVGVMAEEWEECVMSSMMTSFTKTMIGTQLAHRGVDDARDTAILTM